MQEFSSEMGFDAVIWSNTPLLVERDNSLPGAVLAEFGKVVLLSVDVAIEERLGL